MKRRILIVDDEEPARLRIRRFLAANYPDFLVREAADGFDALEIIPEFCPDLVFLDVEMPELTGFDVLRHVSERLFRVIFQTAYDEFALRAFEVNACDYLLKPYPDDRIKQAVERSLGRASDRLGHREWENLEGHFRENGLYLERFVVRVGAKSKVIEWPQVLYFESCEHFTYLHTATTSYLYEHALTYLEQHIDPRIFLRVHRNAIVNLHAIIEFRHRPPFSVTVSNRGIIPVSRNRAAALRQKVPGILLNDC